jgi:hypothetical protein
LLPSFAFVFEVIFYKCRRRFRIAAKYKEQNTFECISPSIDAEEMQLTQNTQDLQIIQEVDKLKSDHSDAEEQSAIPVEEKEKEIEMTVENVDTTYETVACSTKDQVEIKDKTESFLTVKDEDKIVTADSSVSVSN